MRPDQPLPAAIEDVAWLSGTWSGTRGAGIIEETWSAVRAGTMVGMFRAVADDGPRFFELLTIGPEVDGLVFRFKHFDRELVGWEDRDEVLVWDLVALDDDGAAWLRRGERRWMVYRREGLDALVVFFDDESGLHAADEEFRFVRV